MISIEIIKVFLGANISHVWVFLLALLFCECQLSPESFATMSDYVPHDHEVDLNGECEQTYVYTKSSTTVDRCSTDHPVMGTHQNVILDDSQEMCSILEYPRHVHSYARTSFKCDQCNNNKIYKNLKSLQDHHRYAHQKCAADTDNRKYKCPLCSTSSVSRKAFEEHIENKHCQLVTQKLEFDSYAGMSLKCEGVCVCM